ncbi:hypothetical protein DAI22_06g076950 [Oryza sativa Japonica Group]|nr:hypothetical protein DAI22_06g076950 [Oryza sativa Japonica Group]
MAALPHTRAPVSGHSHLVLASLRRPPGPSPISRMRLGAAEKREARESGFLLRQPRRLPPRRSPPLTEVCRMVNACLGIGIKTCPLRECGLMGLLIRA